MIDSEAFLNNGREPERTQPERYFLSSLKPEKPIGLLPLKGQKAFTFIGSLVDVLNKRHMF